jgi:amidase
MPATPLHYSTITEIGPLLKAKKLSPVELARDQFRRIKALEPRLQAYATLMEDSAMAAARKAEKEIAAGKYRGALHGVPVAVKDLCYTKGVRTMGGLAVLRDFVPDFDGTAVARLRAAGAVILGKLNLTEGAMGGYNPLFKIPYNPWDAKLSPGGSSSGSGAATAAGMCYGSLGTDTGGSIRFPSACNGVVGLKPTWGRVSRRGVLDLAQSLDHVGPMTRSVADAAVMLQAIAGPDPDDLTTLTGPVPDFSAGMGQSVKGLRVGFDERYASEEVHPETAKAVAAAVKVLQKLGAKVVQVQVPDLRPASDAWRALCCSEALAAHSANYPSRASEYGGGFRSWLEQGASVTGAEYARAVHIRLKTIGALRRVFEGIDALACPSMPTIEPRRSDDDLYRKRYEWVPGRGRFTAPYNFTGQPTLSLPAGISKVGAPLSLQLVGKRREEATLVRLGHAFEQATDHHTRRPGM